MLEITFSAVRSVMKRVNTDQTNCWSIGSDTPFKLKDDL